MLIAGCASLGVAPAETFNQKVAYAIGVHTAVLEATTKGVTAGTISSVDAEAILKQADDSKILIDSAVALSASGDATGATNKLAIATAALSALQTYLASHGGK
jgi:acetylglutamate kinase